MRRVSVKASKSISHAGHIKVVNVRTTVSGKTAVAAKAVLKKR